MNTDAGLTGWGDGGFGRRTPARAIRSSSSAARPSKWKAICDDLRPPAAAQHDRGEPQPAPDSTSRCGTSWARRSACPSRSCSAERCPRTASRPTAPACTARTGPTWPTGWPKRRAGVGGARLPHPEDENRLRAGSWTSKSCAPCGEAIGADIGLAVDANCAYDDGTAVALGRQLEPFDLLWWEEPLWADDLAGYDRLRRLLRIPLASGETCSADWLLRHYVAPRRVHIAAARSRHRGAHRRAPPRATVRAQRHAPGAAQLGHARPHRGRTALDGRLSGSCRLAAHVRVRSDRESASAKPWCGSGSSSTRPDGRIPVPTGPGLGHRRCPRSRGRVPNGVDYHLLNGENFSGAGRRPAAPAAGRFKQCPAALLRAVPAQRGSFAGGPAKTPNLERFAANASLPLRLHHHRALLADPLGALHRPPGTPHGTGRQLPRLAFAPRRTGPAAHHADRVGAAARDTSSGTTASGTWARTAPSAAARERYPAAASSACEPGKTRSPISKRPSATTTKAGPSRKARLLQHRRGRLRRPARRAVRAAGVAFLNEAAESDRPFFLTVSFNAVHPPYHVPEPYNSHVRLARNPTAAQPARHLRRKPRYQPDIMWPFHDTGHMSDDDWRRATAFYRGFVTLLDRALGEVLDALDRQRPSGQHAGGRGRRPRRHVRRPQPLRQGPVLLRRNHAHPAADARPGAPRRARSAPRFFHRPEPHHRGVGGAGRRTSPAEDSRSLLPLIERGDAGWNGPDQAFYRYEWYDGLWFGIRAIRTPEYKYCFNPAGQDETLRPAERSRRDEEPRRPAGVSAAPGRARAPTARAPGADRRRAAGAQTQRRGSTRAPGNPDQAGRRKAAYWLYQYSSLPAEEPRGSRG